MSDIEASTRLWEEHPEAMSRAVPAHYRRLAEMVARHGGVRPTEQGEGDSVVAAFSRASDAVSAALDAQRALAGQAWPDGISLRIRVALHTAEAQLRDEGNYFGAAQNRCARLRAIGNGGQTLITQGVHDLVVDRLPADAEFAAWHWWGTGRLRQIQGRDAEALELFARAVAVADAVGEPVSSGFGHAFHGGVLTDRGEGEAALAELVPAMKRSIATAAGLAIPQLLVAIGVAQAGTGMLEDARATLQKYVDQNADGGIYGMAYGLWMLACVELLLGRDPYVPALLDTLARAAAALDSHEEAARILGAAGRAFQDLGHARWPHEHARMQALEDTLRTELEDNGFNEALAEGREMRTTEAIAWPRRARGRRKRLSGGWASLTPPEVRVVELAVQGLTNAEIGERMFISWGTAKVHLSHVYAKLGVRNRSELAALAALAARRVRDD
jgi:DNA-binding CsgD family transcriptional regulator